MASKILIPGDTIPASSDDIALGPGLVLEDSSNHLLALCAGKAQTVTSQKTDTYYIESNSKRYVPHANDFVVGVITGTFGENYRVSLSNFSAGVQLSIYGFPNASRKNRPNLKIGDLVYARISNCQRDIDIEIECIDPTTGKEGGFGQLTEGLTFDVKLGFARFLLFSKQVPILETLSAKCEFEIAIGVNGRIWIKTQDPKHTITCAQCIQQSQNWSSQETANQVNLVFKNL